MKKTREKKAVIRDKVLSIRVSQPEYEAFLKKHKITGRDVSKVVRSLILNGVKLKEIK